MAPPGEDELSNLALEAPPMKGLEYLDSGVLRAAWIDLDAHVRSEIIDSGKGLHAYLHAKNPLWRVVGRGDVPSGRKQTGRGASVRISGDLRQRDFRTG